jgi:UDP-N-acetylmuramoylalanine--D-glutamate ligase
MDGVENHYSILDCSADICAVQLVHTEVEMILVVGMARSGLAAARLLKSRGEDVFVSDAGSPTTTADLDSLGIPWESGKHTTERFLAADEIVISPGVPSDIAPLAAARGKGVPIVSELEVAWRYLKGDVVAITGSNGKTTTTTLVGEILKAAGRVVQVGGNIGTAMCGLVDTSTAHTVNVIEVSSFQLDGIRGFRPHTAALLNITPDHLDRYDGFAAYRASKFRIFENQIESDSAVLNRDDSQVWPPEQPIRARQSFFSRSAFAGSGAFRADENLYLNGQAVMGVSEVHLRGEHNIENVLASMAITAGYGVPTATLAKAIGDFRGVEHRIEYVASLGGIEFFNDSKATNVDSAIKAVESFDSGLILILGGKDKGAPYDPLVDAMRGKVKHVLLIGEASEKISKAIGSRFACSRVETMADAVNRAREVGTVGDVVLLSPACASFDMFENYEHRGREFKKAVQELIRHA